MFQSHRIRKPNLIRLGILLILALGVGGCVPPPATPAATAPAHPQEIEVSSPTGAQRLTPAHASYGQALTALNELLATVDNQARTLFDPERFAAEVAPIDHVYVRYEGDVEFTGRAIGWRAVELVIAAPGGEDMILARGADSADWSVYLSEDAGAVGRFMATLQQLAAAG